jgi:hypothetical protein
MTRSFRVLVAAIIADGLLWVVSFALMWTDLWFWWATAMFAICTVGMLVLYRSARFDQPDAGTETNRG